MTARAARRPLGQAVRVADTGDRYHGTRGVVIEHYPAFGTVLYRVAAERVCEYGADDRRDGWAGLFFADQLRAQAPKAPRVRKCRWSA